LLPVAIFGIFLILACFSFVALVVNGQLGFFATLLLFACLVSIYVFWNRNLEAISERWGAGAQGEVEVGRELERLHKEGFYVFHDCDSGRGNVDHFVIGPRGVLVVETKALKGEIACENGRFLQNGKIIPKDMTRQAKGEAKTVSELIRSSTGVGAWVVPILCFSDATLSCYGSLNKRMRRRTSMTKKNVHVTPHGDKWAVKREGNERASSLHDTQKKAEDKGRGCAEG